LHFYVKIFLDLIRKLLISVNFFIVFWRVIFVNVSKIVFSFFHKRNKYVSLCILVVNNKIKNIIDMSKN
jgi:hypothetical protein